MGPDRFHPKTTLMSNISHILSAIEQGDPKAAEQLLPLVYEAYLRLVGVDPGRPWEGRGHFFAAAAEAMRRILVDRARDRRRLKRGGSRRRQDLDLDALTAPDAPPDDLLDLDEALGRLDRVDPRAAA